MVDILVEHDGEIPFRKILGKVLKGDLNFEDIPGIIILGKAGVIETGKSENIPRFTRSPWLENKEMFEKIAAEIRSRNELLRIIYETNRGCPYSCSYCNWGSSANSKVRQFDLRNILSELEWLKTLSIDEIMIGDANFGILERDVEIAKKFTIFNENEKKLVIILNPAKNMDRELLRL